MALCEFVGRRSVQVEIGGYVRFDDQPTNSRHRHSYYELCLVLEGSGLYAHGEEEFTIHPGDVFLAEPGVIHEISSFNTRDLHLFFLRMSIVARPDALERSEDSLFSAFEREHVTLRAGPGRLHHYPPLLESDGPQFGNLLRAFLREMLECLSNSELSPRSTRMAVRDDLAAAMQYIEENHYRRIRISEIARHLGISERSLRRRYEREPGTSILEEINQRRMRRAADHLLKGYSASEVAGMVGIEDPAQFSRSFRRVFGVSPKTFQTTYTPGVGWESN